MKRILVFSLVCLSLTACKGSNKHVFQIGKGVEVSTNQLSCSTIVDASMFQDGLEGEGEIAVEVSKGTDKLALTINEDSISIITRAAVEQGISEAERWPILSNTTSELFAVGMREGVFGSNMYSFTLNKETGFAIWSKVSPSLLYVQVPQGFLQFLVCK